jgi:hypothetical protein
MSPGNKGLQSILSATDIFCFPLTTIELSSSCLHKRCFIPSLFKPPMQESSGGAAYASSHSVTSFSCQISLTNTSSSTPLSDNS